MNPGLRENEFMDEKMNKGMNGRIGVCIDLVNYIPDRFIEGQERIRC